MTLTGSASADAKEIPPLDRIIRQIQDNTTTIHDIQKGVENTIAYLEGQPPPSPVSTDVEKPHHEGAMNQLRFEADVQSECLVSLRAAVANLGGTV